mgnify:CR=1 FL=1|jgi:hypothetical protein|nr:MAG TPA: hypothetical protein [Bacteriophage sp.]
MSNAFTVMFLIAIIVTVALMISICIAGTVFLLEETGVLDIFREIIHKKEMPTNRKIQYMRYKPWLRTRAYGMQFCG